MITLTAEPCVICGENVTLTLTERNRLTKGVRCEAHKGAHRFHAMHKGSAARRIEMVSLLQAGLTLREVGEMFGVTREYVRQEAAKAGMHDRPALKMRRERLAAELRDKHRHVCAVCLRDIEFSLETLKRGPKNIRTCGPECAELWGSLRQYLYQEERERIRVIEKRYRGAPSAPEGRRTRPRNQDGVLHAHPGSKAYAMMQRVAELRELRAANGFK